MRNKLWIFIALLLIGLAVLAVQMRSGERVTDLESRSLLSATQLEQLATLQQVRLQRGDAVVELAQQDGGWGLVSRSGFPVRAERLAALLHALRGARVVEEKTADAQHHARLGLDPAAPGDDTLQVQLQDAQESYGLIYGNQVGSGQLVRFAGQDQVLLINRPLRMSVNPTDWLALNVVSIPLEHIARARWTNASGEVIELDKQAEGDYNLRLAGEQASAGNERKINSMVLALTNFTAQDVALRDDLSLVEPIQQMQVVTWSGAQLDASVYAQEGRFWLLIDQFSAAPEPNSELQVNADQRWAYQLGIGQLEALQQQRADLLSAQTASSP